MQALQKQVKSYYESGFPKEVTRNKYNLKINERLKAARNRKKLSSASVVKKLKEQGVSIGHSTLQGYEADESSLNHRYPSIQILVELAEFYGCSLDYIFGLSDRFRPNNIGSREIDIQDILDGKTTVYFNGKKLKKFEREAVANTIEKLLTEE